MPSGCSRPRLISMTCRRSLAGVDPLAARVVGLGVEETRQRFAKISRREADHPGRPGEPRDGGRLDQPLQVDARRRNVRAGSHASLPARDRPPCAPSRSLTTRQRSTAATRSSNSRCFALTSQSIRTSGSARRSAAATGIAWTMSPSAPSRTISSLCGGRVDTQVLRSTFYVLRARSTFGVRRSGVRRSFAFAIRARRSRVA